MFLVEVNQTIKPILQLIIHIFSNSLPSSKAPKSDCISPPSVDSIVGWSSIHSWRTLTLRYLIVVPILFALILCILFVTVTWNLYSPNQFACS